MSTPQLLPFGYEYTIGNQIVDANANPVRITAINWFGMETGSYAPGGLQYQSYKTMMNEMVQEGFNTIRLPFSLQLFNSGSTPNSINYTLNPDLKGLNGLGIMDAVVAYAGQIGLKIILDNHRSSAYSGPNSNGLWYADGYSQAQWLSTWQTLATHYAGNSTVIGADIANEPHGSATWGGGGATDWHAAATLAGDTIQSVNPNWLVFVQGVQNDNNTSTWWGANLQGVATDPVVLNVSNHVVYEVHDYPPSVGWQSYFGASNYPNNLASVWSQNWGYIYQQDIAPVFVGEFGTKLQSTADQQWLSALVSYLDNPGGTMAAGQGISWGYWAWNPNSGDTGGILNNDWTTINQAKINAIAAAFFYPSQVTSTTPLPAGVATSATAATTATGTTTTPATPATPSTPTTTPSVTYTPIDGGSLNGTQLNLGDGNFNIGISGIGDVIVAGNGSDIVGQGAYSPVGGATISLGAGNSIVTAFGTGNSITAGDGSDIVMGPQGNATVKLGTGDQTVVLFGTGNNIVVGNTASPADTSHATFVNAGSGNDTVMTGDGTIFVLGTGPSNIITVGTGGSANTRAFVFLADGSGNQKVTALAGNNWIVVSGQNNVIDGGIGSNVVWSGQGNDRFVLHQGGTDYIYGFGLGSSDRLDLTQALAGQHITTDLSTLSRYIQVTAGGSDALVSLDPTGHGAFTSAPVAVLRGEAAVSLAGIQALNGFLLPSG